MLAEAELEAQFIQLALKRSNAFHKGRVSLANRLYDALHELKNEMRKLPDRGEAALKRICGNSDAEVRIFAAAALLAIDECFALSVLRQVESSKLRLTSFSARMLISEWNAGKLRDYLS